MKQLETEVLIVGGGPVGLSSALALSTYGISVMVVTKHQWISTTPRAHVTNQRTFEILRDFGLEAEAMAVATPYTQLPDVVFCTSLSGQELARMKALGTGSARRSGYMLSSPCESCDLAQNLLEPILLKNAISRGAIIHFNTEYLRSIQDEEGVTASLLDRTLDKSFEVRAKYMIGADGAGSRIVEELKLPIEGEMNTGASANILFECDLTRYVSHRPAVLYFLLGDGSSPGGDELGILRPTRRWNQWLLIKGYAEGVERVKLTKDDAITVIRNFLGDASLSIKIGAIDPWALNSAFATQYSVGRIFCAGDSVHRHAPSNGLGSNTGIQDSYNLAWKLALVLQGKAGTSLLGSYDAERVPIGQQVVKRATKSLASYAPLLEAFGLIDKHEEGRSNLEKLSAAGTDGRSQREALRTTLRMKQYEFNAHGVEMNQHYSSSAIISNGTTVAAPNHVDAELNYIPTTAPGSRLPHVWLQRGVQPVSTLDLVGKGRFTVLTGIGGEVWKQAVSSAEKHFRLPIEMHVIGIGCAITDLYAEWAELREISETGCLLIRPDGYVGWRLHEAPDSDAEAHTLLHDSLSTILGLLESTIAQQIKG